LINKRIREVVIKVESYEPEGIALAAVIASYREPVCNALTILVVAALTVVVIPAWVIPSPMFSAANVIIISCPKEIAGVRTTFFIEAICIDA
jgi:uncharacterized membrane protein